MEYGPSLTIGWPSIKAIEPDQKRPNRILAQIAKESPEMSRTAPIISDRESMGDGRSNLFKRYLPASSSAINVIKTTETKNGDHLLSRCLGTGGL